jgi:hypothetical protein
MSLICFGKMAPIALPLTFNSQPRPQYPTQPYLQNGTSGPVPGAQPLLPNNGRIIQAGPTRVLCVADVRGISQSKSKQPYLKTNPSQAI